MLILASLDDLEGWEEKLVKCTIIGFSTLQPLMQQRGAELLLQISPLIRGLRKQYKPSLSGSKLTVTGFRRTED